MKPDVDGGGRVTGTAIEGTFRSWLARSVASRSASKVKTGRSLR